VTYASGESPAASWMILSPQSGARKESGGIESWLFKLNHGGASLRWGLLTVAYFAGRPLAGVRDRNATW